jgi:hypothetical protein
VTPIRRNRHRGLAVGRKTWKDAKT